jgi:hypothetical protein
MKDMHRDKAHPAPKGGGMPYFEKEHWQKSVNDIELADTKYSSEMNQLEEYTKSVDAQSAYFKKHKEKH